MSLNILRLQLLYPVPICFCTVLTGHGADTSRLFAATSCYKHNSSDTRDDIRTSNTAGAKWGSKKVL
jgi:hypothetical protein